MKASLFICLSLFLNCCTGLTSFGQDPVFQHEKIYKMNRSAETRWISFENIKGSKGQGGKENHGAKGHPSHFIPAGQKITVMDFKGTGIIQRMWFTINDRSPEMLRGLLIKIYWDNADRPAVSVPFGDFFGVGNGQTTIMENALFINPEGRSFTSLVPMPFKEAARIEIVNEGKSDLNMIYFDINLQKLEHWDNDNLYFHAFWFRDTLTALTKDFLLTPKIEGSGRYLGTNVSFISNPQYGDSWWGEGEVKIYTDGDLKFPTLVGTGTEDYIGTGWGQGKFINQYAGCTIADTINGIWSYYRFHIPDPVYFKTDIRITIQVIGGNMKDKVIALQNKEVPLHPISIFEGQKLHHLFEPGNPADLKNKKYPDGWTNFYRQDDIAAVTYFYLDKASNNLPDIQAYDLRIYKLNMSADIK